MTRRILSALLAVAAVGCSEPADTTTSPTTVELATATAEMFTGTLNPGSLRFYSFSLARRTAYSVLLGSLRTADTPAAADIAVGLGVGTPAGTGCNVRESVVTTPALARQIVSWGTEGIHCVAIYDAVGLSEPVSFAIRLVHY